MSNVELRKCDTIKYNKIDGRKAKIINKRKRYVMYTKFANNHGYPDAAVDKGSADTRKPLENGDIVTLLVSGLHELSGDTLWIVETANGDRYIISEDGIEIITEPTTGITVLPDKSLGGVLREYREVARRANVGERIKIVNNDMMFGENRVGEVHTVVSTYRSLVNTDGKWNDGSTFNPSHINYVVLEPTDIVWVCGVRYRMVEREAVDGERVIVTRSNFADGKFFATGHIGTVIKNICPDRGIYVNFTGEGNSFVDGDGRWYVGPFAKNSAYAVLKPVPEDSGATPENPQTEYADLQRQIDRIAETLAEIGRRLLRMKVELRVACEDIKLIEGSVAKQIKAVEARVKTLEDAIKRDEQEVPDLPITRDEVIERARADVAELERIGVDMHGRLPEDSPFQN